MSGPAVVGLATETDLERLRQMALLLEAENARLHRRLGELTRALAQATGATQAQLELEVQRLQAQLAARTRALFGPSSERRGGDTRADAPSAPAPRRWPARCGRWRGWASSLTPRRSGISCSR